MSEDKKNKFESEKKNLLN